MSRRLPRGVAALLVAVLALAPAACRSSPEDDPEADLRARVQLVRSAVETRDVETARSALNGLRDATVEHRLSGAIEFERAQAIITAANHVEEHLGELDRDPPTEPDEEQDPEEAEPEADADGDEAP